MKRFPLNLQFFAEGDGGGAGAANTTPAATTPATQPPAANPAQQTQAVQQPSADDIANAIFKAVDNRTHSALRRRRRDQVDGRTVRHFRSGSQGCT